MTTGLGMVLLFAAFALYGAYSDLRFRTIPNAFNAAMAVAGLAATWLADGGTAAAYGLAHLTVALAVGMALFALGMWGGGDAKFYAATAAWFALWDFPKLAFAIALTGVVLVFVWFGGRQLRRGPKLDMKSRELPYGVAIAVGGLAALAIGL